MTVKEQQRRNAVVSKIRELQAIKSQQGGLGFEENTELTELQIEADENIYFYW